MPASSWMHSSRRFTTEGRSTVAAWFTTATAGRNTCLSSTPSASRRPASNRQSETSRLPKPKINIMLLQTTSIWQHDSQPKASGRPGAVQNADAYARTVLSDCLFNSSGPLAPC